MEQAIKDQLGLENLKILKLTPNTIETDQGRMFLKYGDETLVNGEFESLKAIQATGAIRCPKPIGIVKKNESTALITSYIAFRHRKNWAMLGEQLGRMHMKNAENLSSKTRRSGFVAGSLAEDVQELPTEKFGFHVATCCGRLPQDNTWTDSWTEFFIQRRLKPQIDRLIETSTYSRDLLDLESALYRKTDELLRNRRGVTPALVHGDLWGGNWSMMVMEYSESKEDDMVPVVFDPAASYSDPEFEFGIMSMFGGWTAEFEREYDKVMGDADKKSRARRLLLYELYHNLNHWNHFGGSYRSSSLSLIRQILGDNNDN